MLRTRPVFEGRASERIGGAMREFLEFRALENWEKKEKKKKTKWEPKANTARLRKLRIGRE